MKYLGRLTATLPFLIMSVWHLQHIFQEETVSNIVISLILSILTVIVAWFMGGQYDQAQFYYKELLKNKKDLQVKQEEFKDIFDSVDATIWSNDLINERIYVSKGIEKLSGYTVKQFFDDFSFWTKISHPADTPLLFKFYEKVLAGVSDNFEARFLDAQGEPIWVYMSGTPIFGENNEVIKINGVVVDIRERKKTEAMLQESESRYRNVVELSPNIILIHQNDRIVYVNPATTNMLGLNATEILGKTVFDFIDPSDKETIMSSNREIYEKKRPNEYREYKIIKPDGSFVYLEMLGKEINYNGVPAIMVVAIDVTAKKAYQEKVQFMAFHDALTGLPNRHMYNEFLETAMARSKKHNQVLAVMFLDLDRFKFINDTMGHEAGDDLLKKVSEQLLKSVRKGDMVSRQGGDEFAIILEDVDELIVREISDRIIEAFSTPFMIKNKEFYTSASIGISLYPLDGQDKETISSKADTAMYLAKKRGKNNYQFFIHEQGDILDRKIKLEQNLRRALKNNEFYLEYQPKLELETGEIYGVEALVRWKHPELGIIAPTEFIPIVEESGLISNFGSWILNEACKQNKKWHESGIRIKMAVNVSALQFEDANFVETVRQVLSRHQLPPQSLGLEITESVMQNIERSSIIIHELKLLGVKISVDDFGTGYSSLSVLSNLPIDLVKIDKSFINEILINANTASLVKTMIEMGQNLGFQLVAEGIEKKQQAEFLMNHGCRFGQGYYYSPPLAAAEVEKMLKAPLVKSSELVRR
ncbi:bifunctional diguanylate cyclase/phosphodiesterase [Mesobacillus harenae]|uniref:bifunctional diguanylate cyclase/phosphodiesterase n=1 Tax=Mesobacillus harenae TaxID=2213203 RepID=UPI00157FD55E|nr:bifunctional diguanylate cyclase/phosphodiesterase [Mesobacillus harenae]